MWSPGQDPQTARIDRDRFVNAELGREVGHRQGAQDVGIRLGPRAPPIAEILFQPAVVVVDPAVQHHLGSPRRQPLRREFTQQSDGIVIQLPPTDRVQISKQAVDFRVPSPPEVSRQGVALVEQRLGRQFAHDFNFGYRVGRQRVAGVGGVGSAGDRSLMGLLVTVSGRGMLASSEAGLFRKSRASRGCGGRPRSTSRVKDCKL